MGIPRLKQTQKTVKGINIGAWLRIQLKKRDLSMRKLSLLMGMSENYLHIKCKTGDFKGAELVHIGNYLDTNPFEPYLHLLNERARPTATETEQAEKITEMEENITALEKERDWLKEVVMKKWLYAI